MTEITVETTLHELDIAMLEKLKDLFADEAIVQIRISNVSDETAHLFQDVSEANVIMYEEAWRNQEDLERHIRSEKYKSILAAMDMASEVPEIRFHTVSHTAGMEVIQAVRDP